MLFSNICTLIRTARKMISLMTPCPQQHVGKRHMLSSQRAIRIDSKYIIINAIAHTSTEKVNIFKCILIWLKTIRCTHSFSCPMWCEEYHFGSDKGVCISGTFKCLKCVHIDCCKAQAILKRRGPYTLLLDASQPTPSTCVVDQQNLEPL